MHIGKILRGKSHFIKVCFLLLVYYFSNAQVNHIDVFKGQSGNTLFQSLISEYKTQVLLDYTRARDTLFAKIDAVGDSLECKYTGLTLYLPPGEDPTQAVFLNGIPNGINTEHAYPQSKGASNFGRSDMHHLYPTRTKTNSDRMSNPLGEIPDNETRIWYFKDTERSTPPTVNRDLYSESTTMKFEPRESVKGDIARAVFYFYTMYRQDADNADPNFFNIQKNDLCEWHYNDPVDKKEWERTYKIAAYQDGKVNPFVLDCSLAARIYCNNISQACEGLVLSSVYDIAGDNNVLNVFPNPSGGNLTIRWNLQREGIFGIDIKDITGRSVYQVFNGFLSNGDYVWSVHDLWNEGVYFIYVTDAFGAVVTTHKVLILR